LEFDDELFERRPENSNLLPVNLDDWGQVRILCWTIKSLTGWFYEGVGSVSEGDRLSAE